MPYQIKNGIIYSGNAVTLTQAQYDALTTAEKNNGTVYYIYDSDAMIEAQEVGLDGGNVETLAGSVATIETSPATANHEVGEYILWNGVVYVVTSAIATGENLVINSNISARTVGEELTALNNGLNGLHLISTVVNGTTTSFGTITIPNPAGRTTIFLLRNTYLDDVSGSFGVLNVDSTTDTTITLRCRTLKDGNVNAGAPVITTLVFAYL